MSDFLRTYVFKTEESDRIRRKALQENFLQQILRKEAGADEGETIRVKKEAKGKPYCADYPDLHFNMSDSGSYTVLAVSSRRVGADVERVRTRPAEALLQRWFLPEEKPPAGAFAVTVPAATSTDVSPSTHPAVPPGTSSADFIYLWTCKESLLKYIGCGLDAEMKQHPVRWRTDPISKKPIPYAFFEGEELAFSSFLLQQPEGDFILTLCHSRNLPGRVACPAVTGKVSISLLFPEGTVR